MQTPLTEREKTLFFVRFLRAAATSTSSQSAPLLLADCFLTLYDRQLAASVRGSEILTHYKELYHKKKTSYGQFFALIFGVYQPKYLSFEHFTIVC
jgi:hypothetical protein